MSRARRAWTATGAAALIVALAGAAPAPDAGVRRSVAYTFHTMGTYVTFHIVTADSVAGAALAERGAAVLFHLDSLMSNWTTTSEVARINREAASHATRIDPEVATVVDTSLRVWRESDGVFDITVEPLMRAWGFLGGQRRVPSDSEAAAAAALVGAGHVHYDPATRTIRFDRPGVKIDLGGIAKGYAVDRAADALRAAGVSDALVDLTGNMKALGHPPDAPAWRIGIRDPRDRLPYFARLTLKPGEGISTSGKYEQFIAKDGKTYGHIMDPRTGRPADGLISVTVVSGSGFACDTWDTPIFVLGAEAGRQKALEHRDLSVVLVSPGPADVDTVWVESTLRDRFVLESAAAPHFVVRYF